MSNLPGEETAPFPYKELKHSSAVSTHKCAVSSHRIDSSTPGSPDWRNKCVHPMAILIPDDATAVQLCKRVVCLGVRGVATWFLVPVNHIGSCDYLRARVYGRGWIVLSSVCYTAL